MSIFGKMKGLAVALLVSLSADPATALDYGCGQVTGAAPDGSTISEISIGKSMLTFKAGKTTRTARMANGGLTRRTYLDEVSVIILYGDWVKGADGSPAFGRSVRLQRVYYHPTAPSLFQTTCEART